MQNVTSKHVVRQVFLALAGFVVVIVLLESGGLKEWAEHLEPGAMRTVALPAMAAIDHVVRPLGISSLRDHALDESARTGWSDDAARVARASKPAIKYEMPAQPPASPAPIPSLPSLPAAVSSPAISFAPVGSSMVTAPVAAAVPRSTHLAPLPPVAPGKPRVVALTGDSMMAVGLSATMLREAAGDKNLRLVKAFRSGTGLARPDVFNWMDEYPAMVGTEKPDVVIVSIGANDGQGFVVDGKVQAFGTDAWRKTYQSRVSDYLALVESSGARIVWVGLPPMRSAAFNDKIDMINRIAYAVISRDTRATWWNSAPFVADEFGRFREFLALANGKNLHVRSDDGIHYSDEGAALMTSVLMKWLDPPPATASTEPVQSPATSASTTRGVATVAAVHPELRTENRPRVRRIGF